jgi:hypothetical protein
VQLLGNSYFLSSVIIEHWFYPEWAKAHYVTLLAIARKEVRMITKVYALCLLSLLSKATPVSYGPEEDKAAADAAAAKAAEEKKAADDAAAAKAKAAKTYTQDEVDKMSAAQRYGYKKEMEKQAAELEKLSSDKRLSQEERDQYAKRLEDVESQYKTQSQLAEEKAKKAETEYKKKLETAEVEVKTYKSKYANTLMDNELTQEAARADEQIPGQLKKYLRPDTVLVDEIVDGKATGEHVVRISFDDVDAEGKPVKLLLPVKEAMKRMKELPERFGNFFKGVGSPGVGAGNGRGGGGSGGSMPQETGAYLAARKANKG